jgi:16S rRNA (guanine966-N2)-methyltransferase
VRIIAGTLKGRRLTAPRGLDVRPTSDSLRETLFNVLGPSVDGARVLDAFAGTGALGLEALSRGASHVTFVERASRALTALEENVARCGVAEACAIIRGDFLRVRSVPAPFDLALIDPPYDIGDLAAVLEVVAPWIAPDGRVVLEHSRRRSSPGETAALVRGRVLTAGDSALSFYTGR